MNKENTLTRYNFEHDFSPVVFTRTNTPYAWPMRVMRGEENLYIELHRDFETIQLWEKEGSETTGDMKRIEIVTGYSFNELWNMAA